MHSICYAYVMHHRLKPVSNKFVYKSYNLLIKTSELSTLNSRMIKYNKSWLFSIWDQDYTKDKNTSMQQWLDKLHAELEVPINNVYLLTMPRVLGHCFNPVSFWFFNDNNDRTVAIIADVNNTFRENHQYLINCKSDHLKVSQSFKINKNFHVSPFLPVQGYYEFRFLLPQSFRKGRIGIYINYFENTQKILLTSIVGNLAPLSDKALIFCLWRHFILPLKVIFLIHYQALKLWVKKVPFFKKPPPPIKRLSK